MNKLDFENVMARFRNLSHLTEEEAKIYIPTVNSAKAYFERLLLRDPSDGEEQGLCEYACAAKAFFDYTILCAATAKVYSTQSGGIYARMSEDETVMNAEKLMNNAFAAVPSGLIRDDGFVFESTEG